MSDAVDCNCCSQSFGSQLARKKKLAAGHKREMEKDKHDQESFL